ncbi:hypothetical protein POSPLADRAFT_1044921 [Postia placenta MAD-698-R-SB12]|uniref:DNA 3'-5' helicase n=1 Tax=Postia placenta MAD-698-R-SB12 TaxID=670580 RepID=A0A1X6NAF5_9APHY|nr:hypothetical protein POSPLADRAFT_1044921 [Postia placenta MAD-698-R-SB12]OSX65591.1 hypothetical protein POSPLADRAFT_1044921 [Postia placenta MAD-698-R-SB12]
MHAPFAPIPVSADVYRGMFKFGVFNAVQSQCFDIVCAAPTGSGKTVLFELAIIRMLMQSGGNSNTSKCIYIAPTKALCSEKCREWTTKFQALGVNCCELTGDTVQLGKNAWGNARDASIMYGEKWDSLTRSWRRHGQILSQIQLFLIDEVHILNESRGSTLEVVLSRMKARGSSVRFVVVSATVPNIKDVASWIGDGTPDGSATVMQFGEEFRPCRLSKFVYGFFRKREQNDFVFQTVLNAKLYGILQQHSVNKPMLVFCSTRKGVMGTADQILKEYEEASQKKQALPWTRPPRYMYVNIVYHSRTELAAYGIGIHHAGMSMDDRRATEDLYLRKLLRILFATSTLAVGVNLPAHTVIIKGVKVFQNNACQEYSDLDIMQMMGRAGRPQFDKEGVAIIMCETELEAKYNALVQGQTLLESCLHLNLSEHINSEVGLGTITDLNSAKAWLHNSFLFRRIQQNPKHYAIGKECNQTWQERVDEMVTESITKLRQTELVMYSDDTQTRLCSTEYGDVMSKFYIKQSTVIFLFISYRGIFIEELKDGAHPQPARTRIYNRMRGHNDIRYQLKKVEKPADKIFILIQAVLGCISLSDPEYKSGDSNPSLEASSVFRHVVRIAKAIVEVAILKKAGGLLKSSLEVYLLNRRPPFGHEVIAAVQQFPQYLLNINEVDLATFAGKKPIQVELSIKCGLTENLSSNKPKRAKDKSSDMTIVFTVTSDLDFLDFRRIPTKALKESKTFSLTAELSRQSQSITVYITSESIAGVTVSNTYKPTVNAKEYPTPDTRPQTSVEVMLEGFEEDPDFWNMGPDDDDVPVKLEKSQE